MTTDGPRGALDVSLTKRRFLLSLGVVAGIGATLGGCGILGIERTSETFDLTAPRDVKSGRASPAQILVPEPQALRAFDTDRIVVRPRPAEINYLADAQWSDRLPRLIQARLVETYENSGRVRAAGRPGQGLLVDYQLVTEIRAFEFDASNASAVVEVSIKLLNDRNGRVVATEVFRSEQASTSNAAALVTDALDVALDRTLRDILTWTLKHV